MARLRTRLSACLDRFESGRALKAHLHLAMHENSPEPRMHARLAHIRYINVEASYLCNLKCRMCPRLAEGHREGLMPIERFLRLAPLFSLVEFVVLTGYGEPLVHPRLAEFVAAVRGYGAKPRLSTNGTLLDEMASLRLIDAGLENLQFSIDAGTKQTYESIREGANWEQVLANAARFHKLCQSRHAQIGTGWVYVVMRDNFRELPLAVQQAADAGFPLFVAKFIERNMLDYEHDQVLHASDGRLLISEGEFEDRIGDAAEIARRNGQEFRLHPYHFGVNGTCLADVLSAFFVDWLGNVTPCCHLPVRSDLAKASSFSFGNIDEQDIMELLLDDRAQFFWNSWMERRIPWECRACYQLHRLPERHTYGPAEDRRMQPGGRRRWP